MDDDGDENPTTGTRQPPDTPRTHGAQGGARPQPPTQARASWPASSPVNPTTTTPSPSLRIALVEDDRQEATRAMEVLSAAGHAVAWYQDGLQFMSEVREARHDLFLLDWHLPDTEGVTLVGWVHRVVGPRAPIIMFSRFDEDERVVEALAAGADDYVVKPTTPAVLLARIAAVLRRLQPPSSPPQVITLGAYRLEAATRELRRHGQRIDLQPKEFELAWHLFEHRDRLVRRDELVAAVWGRDLPGSARTLDTHLYTLRRKLQFAEHGLRLSNVYREGYRLEQIAPVDGA